MILSVKLGASYYRAWPLLDFNDEILDFAKNDQYTIEIQDFKLLDQKGLSFSLSILRYKKLEFFLQFGFDDRYYKAVPLFTYADKPDYCADCEGHLLIRSYYGLASFRYPLWEKKSWSWYVEPGFGFATADINLLYVGNPDIFTEDGYSYSYSSGLSLPIAIGLSSTISYTFYDRLSLVLTASYIGNITNANSIMPINLTTASGNVLGPIGPINLNFNHFQTQVGVLIRAF